MDRGIWATWYDLPEDGSADAYFKWLHETYLPEALKRPGYMWAAHYELIDRKSLASKVKDHLVYVDDPSVPTGTEYLLLMGGETANTFLNPSPAQIREKESAETLKMLDKRIGERACIFAEVDRVKGPEAASRPEGTTPAPVVQMGSYNCFTPEDDFDLSAWYAQNRLPELGRMPGAVCTRKLVSAAGWAKHSIFYEFVSLDVVKAHFPRSDKLISGENEWSYEVVKRLLHAPGSPTLARRIWPAVS